MLCGLNVEYMKTTRVINEKDDNLKIRALQLNEEYTVGNTGIKTIYKLKQMSNCFICLEDLDDNVYYLSSCDHGYHTRCLVDWFYTNKTTFCPCCMNELSTHTNEPVDFACASRCARKKMRRKNFQDYIQNTRISV